VFRFALFRLGESAALFVALSIIIFTIATIVPGDVALTITGQNGATPAQLAALKKSLGLDKPVTTQYWKWFSHAVSGDLGVSPITHRSINHDIAQQFPVSLELGLFSIVLAVMIGLPIGVYAATHVDSVTDKILRGGALLLYAFPTFVSGVLLVLIGSRYIQPLFASFYVSPTTDLLENLRVLFLPSLAVAFATAGEIAQLTRSTMIRSLREDFIVTARAKGLREWRVRYLHALKDALAPVVTLIGLQLGSLVGGLIIVEQIFNLPGLGRGVLTAILARDYNFAIAGVLAIAGVYLAVNVAVDLLYPVLDPRQRRG
jgi:peptide/nickel transport system permease protein